MNDWTNDDEASEQWAARCDEARELEAMVRRWRWETDEEKEEEHEMY